MGIIYLNILCLVGKPMLLLNTLLSFAITAVAILMRISALQVLSLDKVAPLLKFDTPSSSSPFMVTLALMLFMLFSMILNISVLKTVLYALHLQSVVLPGIDVRCCCHYIYVVSQMKATDEPVINWNGSVLFVEGFHVWFSRAKHWTEQGRVNTPIWRLRDARKISPIFWLTVQINSLLEWSQRAWMPFIKPPSIVPPFSSFQRLSWQTVSNALLKSMKLW